MPADDFAIFAVLRQDLVRHAAFLLRGSRVRTHPEDLAQTVLTRILNAMRTGKLHPEALESPRGFAYKCLRNLFFDEVKAYRSRLEAEYFEQDEGEPGQHDTRSLAVKQVLARLLPEESCFLTRVVLEERSVTEAQQLCRWPPKAPYYHLRLLLARVREMLS